MKLIHLTDLHLITPAETLYGLDPAARLRSAIMRINADHADAEICVITGDLADTGAPEAYQKLRVLLSDLVVPWRLLPGNHDHRANLANAFPEQARDANGFFQSAETCSAGRLILLDTLVEGHGHGALNAGRLQWLAERLDEQPTTPTYIFSHHPLQPIGMPHFAPIDMVDTKEVMAVLTRHGNVSHVFCGHVHVDVSGSWQGIAFHASRGIAHQIVPNLVRTDADFVAGDPAFVVAMLSEEASLIHRFEVSHGQTIIANSPTITPKLGDRT